MLSEYISEPRVSSEVLSNGNSAKVDRGHKVTRPPRFDGTDKTCGG